MEGLLVRMRLPTPSTTSWFCIDIILVFQQRESLDLINLILVTVIFFAILFGEISSSSLATSPHMLSHDMGSYGIVGLPGSASVRYIIEKEISL
jgi:hypothetical protein